MCIHLGESCLLFRKFICLCVKTTTATTKSKQKKRVRKEILAFRDNKKIAKECMARIVSSAINLIKIPCIWIFNRSD